MKLIALVLCLYFTDTTDLSGEWVLRYKTFGKMIEREMRINQSEETILVGCGDEEFEITLDGNTLNWELEVPSIRTLMKAHFKGKLMTPSKMAGIIMMSKYPLNGRAVKWTARRKKPEEGEPENP